MVQNVSVCLCVLMYMFICCWCVCACIRVRGWARGSVFEWEGGKKCCTSRESVCSRMYLSAMIAVSM